MINITIKVDNHTLKMVLKNWFFTFCERHVKIKVNQINWFGNHGKHHVNILFYFIII